MLPDEITGGSPYRASTIAGGDRSRQPSPKVPLLPRFRVAFYIHNWCRRLGLSSSYGRLELPCVKPMPKHLWALVLYQSVG